MTKNSLKFSLLTRKAQGFTLIELLIVIVIIGILAGVLIAVIDPAAQQNRAKDANVRATMNKVALSTSGFVSAYGRMPNEIEFLGSLANVSANGATCGTGTEANCTFQLTNLPLSSTCAAGTPYKGTAPNVAQCYFFYCGGDGTDDTNCAYTASGAGSTDYRLFAKAFGSPNVFMYRSNTSSTWLCDSNAANCTEQRIGQ